MSLTFSFGNSIKMVTQYVPGTLFSSGRALQVGVGPDLLGHLQALLIADWGLLQLTQLLQQCPHFYTEIRHIINALIYQVYLVQHNICFLRKIQIF